MVFGEGDPDSRVMFVGEAPGRQEAETGRPFIGRSGQLLRSLIRGIGLTEEDVYITSPVKYLPEYGTPKKQDIVHARTHFDRQVGIIAPQILVLLGKTAMYAVLDEDISILKHHGQMRERDGRTYFLTLHPAAVLRFSKYKSIIEEDFRKLKNHLTRDAS
jgi:DNA polymerase